MRAATYKEYIESDEDIEYVCMFGKMYLTRGGKAYPFFDLIANPNDASKYENNTLKSNFGAMKNIYQEYKASDENYTINKNGLLSTAHDYFGGALSQIFSGSGNFKLISK